VARPETLWAEIRVEFPLVDNELIPEPEMEAAVEYLEEEIDEAIRWLEREKGVKVRRVDA
jgi:hypothetical protein